MLSVAFIKAQDANTDSRLRLAQTYEQSGQFDKAEVIYRELIEIQPLNNVFFEDPNFSRLVIDLKQLQSY